MFTLYGDGKTVSAQLPADPLSGLPLLTAADDVLNLAINHLPLPYSVVEFGCGQKCSILLNLLLGNHVPGYALHRGLVLEADLSPAALEECDFEKRKSALVISNPLHDRVLFSDEPLLVLLDEAGIEINAKNGNLTAGSYVLSCRPRVQFAKARSHVFSIIHFWDEENETVVERVLDPSLTSERLFEVGEIRQLLQAPEAVLTKAPLLGRFRLAARHVTRRQQEKLKEILRGKALSEATGWNTQAEAIRRLTGAERDSIGDPQTWAYANNITSRGEEEHAAVIRKRTGRGDVFRTCIKRLFEARLNHEEDAVMRQKERFEDLSRELKLERCLEEDAQHAEAELSPLSQVVRVVAYSRSLQELARRLQSGKALTEVVRQPGELAKMHGIGVRLRQRIEELAQVSKDKRGRIDARALNSRYFKAVLGTIKQMNQAGLSVFIDRVGNLHGLALSKTQIRKLENGEQAIEDFSRYAIAIISHMDTVFDAGKYDGRLGVLSGIEILHLFRDLKRLFHIVPGNSKAFQPLQVSAFIGEEMTFTGQKVSLPGSAAVAGLARPESVYGMKNTKGELFRDRLLELLRFLRQEEKRESLSLMNPFDSDDPEELLKQCFEPTRFFTPRTYERHIEQGRVLQKANLPVTLATRVMGICKEDYTLSGERAEMAALEFVRRIQREVSKARWNDARATVGILRPSLENRRRISCGFSVRQTLLGQCDHAGAASMDSRRDPAVAAGVLSKRFVELLRELEKQESRRFTPLIGDITLKPGKSRNVVPDRVSFTLAIRESVPEKLKDFLQKKLNACLHKVADDLEESGVPGIESLPPETGDGAPLNLANQVYLTVDLRTPEEPMQELLRCRFHESLRNLGNDLDLERESEIQQTTQPVSLLKGGQVLQIERSYGGSHNPRETQAVADLLTGTIFQCEAIRSVLSSSKPSEVDLYPVVRSLISDCWPNGMEEFNSGPLHDTCNIARARCSEI